MWQTWAPCLGFFGGSWQGGGPRRGWADCWLSLQAAARHRCSYLVGLHMREFLQVGGSPAWLQGLHCAPQKLRNLNEINKLLAHRPWLVTKEHIEVRADAAGTDPPQNTQADPRGHLLCAQPPGLTLSGLREALAWEG